MMCIRGLDTTQDPTDFREVLISDLDALLMPPIQQRRFLAAKRLLPEPPETMGRRWETPPKWLEAIRLGRFWPPLQTIGVDRVCDFAEILDSDLVRPRICTSCPGFVVPRHTEAC